MNKSEKAFDCIAIVTDLDGTYFAPGGVEHPENVRAIKAFCAQGGYFTYGTGRMHKNIIRVLPDSPTICNLPAVVANGSYLYDFATGERLYPTSMHTADVLAVARAARAVDPTVGVRVVTPDGFMTDGRGEIIAGEVARNPLDFPHVTEIDNWTACNPAEQWFKLVFRAEKVQLDALRPVLLREFADTFEFAVSGDRFLELTRKGCTKASGVQRLRDMFAAQGKKLYVVACGDQENDLAMLKSADLALCPENATDAIKAVCHEVLCHHAKGIMPEVVKRLQDLHMI